MSTVGKEIYMELSDTVFAEVVINTFTETVFG